MSHLQLFSQSPCPVAYLRRVRGETLRFRKHTTIGQESRMAMPLRESPVQHCRHLIASLAVTMLAARSHHSEGADCSKRSRS